MTEEQWSKFELTKAPYISPLSHWRNVFHWLYPKWPKWRKFRIVCIMLRISVKYINLSILRYRYKRWKRKNDRNLSSQEHLISRLRGPAMMCLSWIFEGDVLLLRSHIVRHWRKHILGWNLYFIVLNDSRDSESVLQRVRALSDMTGESKYLAEICTLCPLIPRDKPSRPPSLFRLSSCPLKMSGEMRRISGYGSS